MENYTTFTFEEFDNLCTNNLTLNLDLNTQRSTFRRVQNINNTELIVPFSQNSSVQLNFISLFQIYSLTIENNGIYNKQICLQILPNQTRNHGCIVHIVGMIFVRIRIMEVVDSRNYRIVRGNN
jgi:hypothetical protein